MIPIIAENESKPFKSISTDKIEQFLEILDRMSMYGFSGVVLIAKGDQILHNKGYGYQKFEDKIPMKPETVLSIGSISKQFTATIIMKFVEEGKLDLRDNLLKFFPEISDDKKEITIHQLLTHTSGISDSHGSDFKFIEEAEFLNQVFASPLGSIPGDIFSYSNHGYSILGIILQKLSGKTYQSLLLDSFFKPLSITNAGWFGDPRWNDQNATNYYLDGENKGSVFSWEGSWDKPYWNILANGGVCISAQDLFKWIRTVMTGKIISHESLEIFLKPELNNYAYGWDVEESPYGLLIGHDGGNSIGVNAICKYLKDQEITLIISSNVIANGFGMAMIAGEIMQNLLEEKTLKLPALSHQSSSMDHKKIVGTYQLGNDTLDISLNRINHLQVNIQGQELLNFILNADESTTSLYDAWNKKVEAAGRALLEKDWNETFKFFKNKEPSERRINFMTEMLEMFEQKRGKITSVSPTGSVPFREFRGMTLLTFHGEKSSSGIPIIWESDDTILGVRPMFTSYPMSLPGAFADNKIYFNSFTEDISLIVEAISSNSIKITRGEKTITLNRK